MARFWKTVILSKWTRTSLPRIQLQCCRYRWIRPLYYRVSKVSLCKILEVAFLYWISEIKTSLVISVPGFMAFHNVDPKSSHRGGIVLLVKQNLVKWISRVQIMHSQIWITLEHCSKLLLGGCYLPPNDSIYHDAAILGDIQAQMMSTEGQLPILVGDLNARMWNPEALDE